MTGLSGNDLRHMRAFAEARPDLSAAPAVQRLPWGHIRTLLDEVADAGVRDWYAAAAADHGWSHDVLVNQIMSGSHLRS
jgi:predicted nuclease of restriction endonuclease-like (RecB) superfamily